MAEYQNYFETDNPLNLYNTKASKNTIGIPLTLLWESDEDKRRRQEMLLWQELRRQEALRQLQKEKAQAFVDNLEPYNYDAALAQQAADLQLAHSVDLETGKLRYPQLFDLDEDLKSKLNFGSLYDDFYTIGKDVMSFDMSSSKATEFGKDFKSLVKDNLMSAYDLTEDDVSDFDELWNQSSPDVKFLNILESIGNKYLTGQMLEEFSNSSDTDKFNMLASIVKNNSNYEPKAAKHKRELKSWRDNDFTKHYQELQDHVNERFIQGLTGGDLYDLPNRAASQTFIDVVGGGAASAILGVGLLLGNVVSSIGEYGVSRLLGMGKEEDVDELVENAASNYIDKKSEKKYELLMSLPEKERDKYILEFDALSQGSNEYRAEEGTSLTNLEDNEKLKEYANLATIGELYGSDAAVTEVYNFWKNTIAKKQSWQDKTLRTAGTFVNTGVADAASFAGVMLNPIFMVFDPNDSWSLSPEGYSDALVERNPILNWATNLLETGAYNKRLQDKYKELGVNALQIYKSTADENAFLSWNDAYDIIGQYGFTAATTALSLGGSVAVELLAKGSTKSLLKGLGKNATLQEIKAALRKAGSLASRLTRSKEAREALKAGLASGATEKEITAAKEAIAHIASNKLYRGNLAVGGLMGTAEGALEAKSTYNTFIKDNLERVEQQFEPKYQLLEDKERVREYMQAKGYTPEFVTKDNENNIIQLDYSPEQYEDAKNELKSQLDVKKQEVIDKVKDDAADAAAANFLSNSLINGALNVVAKEAIMSKGVREASRIMTGKNKKFTDLIDIVDKDGTWEAVVKKAVRDNGKRNLWQATKNITGKALKTAVGEALEEYSQGLSDQASRGALQYDMDQYFNTVFNDDARNAFLTDWSGILSAGLNSIQSHATNIEHLKAGTFGALSTLVGGFSPAGIIAASKGFAKGRTEQEKALGAFGYAKYGFRNLSNLYQGAVLEAFRDYNDEFQTALRLTEATNAWLNTAKNQELLTHMGGAEGFKKALEDAIMSGDLLNAHDSKFGLAVENAFMLQALKDTDYGKLMLEKIQLNAELADVAKNENGEFDDRGHYIGNIATDEKGQPVALEDWISKIISNYRNQSGDATRSTALTDLQIVERVGLNATEFIDLQRKIEDALRRVRGIFNSDEGIDPLAEQAFVYALLAQLNTRERKNNLAQKLHEAINTDKLSAEDKEKFKASGLSEGAINFLVEYGSLEQAGRELEKLRQRANKASEDSHNSKLGKEERQAAKYRRKALDKEIGILDALINIEKSRREEDKIKHTAQTTDGETIVLSTEDARTTFSAGDMALMSDAQIAEILTNKGRYSKEQLDIIDQFLSVARKNIADNTNDVALTLEEVSKDFIDLSTLLRRSDAYDNYLVEYIRNPRFLSSLAESYRRKERTRTLRYLYKEDLLMRQGETVLDLEDRLSKKIQLLRDSGKSEDADILQHLISENKDVANVRRNILDTMQALFIYGMLNKENQATLQTPEFRQMLKSLLTAIAESGMSMQDIQKLLEQGKTEEVTKHLQKKLADGQYALNKELAKEGLKPLVTDDVQQTEDALAPVLQSMKNFIDTYVNAKNASTNIGKKRELVATEEAATTTAAPTTAQEKTQAPPDTPKSPLPKLKTEKHLLTLVAPGALDPESSVESESKLRKFMDDKQVSQNLKDFDGASVNFAVVREYGEPVIFAVENIPEEEAVEGKTLNIDGLHYRIIGAMNLEESDTLKELGEEAFKLLSATSADGKLVSLKNQVIASEVNLKTDPLAVSNTHLEEKKTLKSVLKDSKNLISQWVSNLLDRAKIHGKRGNRYLVDHNGYRVLLDEANPATNNIGEFPILDSTLLQILRNCDLLDPDSIKSTIKILKENSFFEAYFDAWKNSSVLDEDANLLYKKLIGDFIYLGNTYHKVTVKDGLENLSAELEELNPRFKVLDSNKYIVIDPQYKDLDSPVEIKLPSLSDNENPEVYALRALRQLVETAAVQNKFAYRRTQLNIDLLSSTSSIPFSERSTKGRKIMEGLIDAGLISGVPVDAINRKVELLNPFIKTGGGVHYVPNSTGANSNVDPIVDKREPQTPKLRIEKALTEAQLKALNIVERIIKAGEGVTLNDSNDSSYDVNGVQHARITSVKRAYSGLDTEPFEASEQVAAISHAYGNTIDPVIRNVFEILNDYLKAGREINAKQLLQEVLKAPEFKGKDSIPNWSNYLMLTGSDYGNIGFIEGLMILHKIFTTKMGWTIVPRDIKTSGMAPVLENGEKVGSLPVAGTLDLLAYDKEGIFHIIDFKTLHETDLGQLKLEMNKKEWQSQVKGYLWTLEEGNDGMQFGKNYIFPVFLSYSIPDENTKVEVAEDKMTVLSGNPNKGPELKIKKKKQENEAYTLEDFLYELDDIPFKGYELGRLSEEDKKKVTSITPTSETPPVAARAKKKEEKEKPETGKFMVDPDDVIDDLFSQESRRTVREARFTEFMNNHIAPIKRARIGVVSKLKSTLRSVIRKGAKDVILLNELANTFFGGDIYRTGDILRDEIISEENMPQIVLKIKDYFSSHILNRQAYVANISRRYNISKAVQSYLKQEITQGQLEEELTKYNTNISSVAELLEYAAAENKSEAAKNILERLLISRIGTHEKYLEELKAINGTIESMQAKMDFLEQKDAVRMFNARFNSIWQSINDGTYEEYQFKSSKSIDDLLQNKSGNYGATKLLRGIALRTLNPLFKRLANTLLRQIKEKGIVIPVIVEDQSINLLEGTTIGRIVTLQKTSLDTYEHMERVLLHEILHAVVRVSPELKNTLLQLLDQTILSLLKTSGETAEQIKDKYYGLRNVDEFISEFFTNYAFLETLKTIGSEDYSNIFNKVVHSMKELFTGDTSLYNLISKTMEAVLETTNVESTHRKIERDEVRTGKEPFDNLSADTLSEILARGFTKEEFDTLTRVEQQLILKCCK